MSQDIKSTVEELEKALKDHNMRACANPKVRFKLDEYCGARVWHEDDEDSEPMVFEKVDKLFHAMREVVKSVSSLLAELRRCWAIVEAAVSLREANEAVYSAEHAKRWDAEMEEIRKKLALFAALPPRKPFGGEESK